MNSKINDSLVINQVKKTQPFNKELLYNEKQKDEFCYTDDQDLESPNQHDYDYNFSDKINLSTPIPIIQKDTQTGKFSLLAQIAEFSSLLVAGQQIKRLSPKVHEKNKIMEMTNQIIQQNQKDNQKILNQNYQVIKNKNPSFYSVETQQTYDFEKFEKLPISNQTNYVKQRLPLPKIKKIYVKQQFPSIQTDIDQKDEKRNKTTLRRRQTFIEQFPIKNFPSRSLLIKERIYPPNHFENYMPSLQLPPQKKLSTLGPTIQDSNLHKLHDKFDTYLNALKTTKQETTGINNKTRQNDVLILNNLQREQMNKTTMESGFKKLLPTDDEFPPSTFSTSKYPSLYRPSSKYDEFRNKTAQINSTRSPQKSSKVINGVDKGDEIISSVKMMPQTKSKQEHYRFIQELEEILNNQLINTKTDSLADTFSHNQRVQGQVITPFNRKFKPNLSHANENTSQRSSFISAVSYTPINLNLGLQSSNSPLDNQYIPLDTYTSLQQASPQFNPNFSKINQSSFLGSPMQSEQTIIRNKESADISEQTLQKMSGLSSRFKLPNDQNKIQIQFSKRINQNIQKLFENKSNQEMEMQQIITNSNLMPAPSLILDKELKNEYILQKIQKFENETERKKNSSVSFNETEKKLSPSNSYDKELNEQIEYYSDIQNQVNKIDVKFGEQSIEGLRNPKKQINNKKYNLKIKSNFKSTDRQNQRFINTQRTQKEDQDYYQNDIIQTFQSRSYSMNHQFKKNFQKQKINNNSNYNQDIKKQIFDLEKQIRKRKQNVQQIKKAKKMTQIENKRLKDQQNQFLSIFKPKETPISINSVSEQKTPQENIKPHKTNEAPFLSQKRAQELSFKNIKGFKVAEQSPNRIPTSQSQNSQKNINEKKAASDGYQSKLQHQVHIFYKEMGNSYKHEKKTFDNALQSTLLQLSEYNQELIFLQKQNLELSQNVKRYSKYILCFQDQWNDDFKYQSRNSHYQKEELFSPFRIGRLKTQIDIADPRDEELNPIKIGGLNNLDQEIELEADGVMNYQDSKRLSPGLAMSSPLLQSDDSPQNQPKTKLKLMIKDQKKNGSFYFTNEKINLLKVSNLLFSLKLANRYENVMDYAQELFDILQNFFESQRVFIIPIDHDLTTQFTSKIQLEKMRLIDKFEFNDKQTGLLKSLISIKKNPNDKFTELIIDSVVNVDSFPEIVIKDNKISIVIRNDQSIKSPFLIIQVEFTNNFDKQFVTNNSSLHLKTQRSESQKDIGNKSIHHNSQSFQKSRWIEALFVKIMFECVQMKFEKILFKQKAKDDNHIFSDALQIIQTFMECDTLKGLMRQMNLLIPEFMNFKNINCMFFDHEKDLLYTITFGDDQERRDEMAKLLKNAKSDKERNAIKNKDQFSDYVLESEKLIYYPVHRGITANVFNKKKCFYANNLQTNRDFDFQNDIDNPRGFENLQNFLMGPMSRGDGSVNGIIQLFNSKSPINNHDQKKLESIGGFFGGCVEMIEDKIKKMNLVISIILDLEGIQIASENRWDSIMENGTYQAYCNLQKPLDIVINELKRQQFQSQMAKNLLDENQSTLIGSEIDSYKKIINK